MVDFELVLLLKCTKTAFTRLNVINGNKTVDVVDFEQISPIFSGVSIVDFEQIKSRLAILQMQSTKC